MELMRAGLLLISIFIGLFSFTHSNPDVFLNINCGANDNVTDNNDLLWISDSPFIKTRNVSLVRSSVSLYLQYRKYAYFTNLRVKKYCYMLPVEPRVNYLVRASFLPGSTSSLARYFDLTIEGIKWRSVNLFGLNSQNYRYYEIILAAKRESLSLCLARNPQTEKEGVVFISTIELRPLESSMYNSTDLAKYALSQVSRKNYGASSIIRYPEDPFDRIWASSYAIGTGMNISTNDGQTKSLGSELPNNLPLDVSRTAITNGIAEELTVPLIDFAEPGMYSFALYFCSIIQTNFTHDFFAFIHQNQISDVIHLNFLECQQKSEELQLDTADPIQIVLQPSSTSQLGTFINGAEMYRKLDVQTTTYSVDVVANRKIAEAINVPDDWTGGDPCLPAGYSSTGITCSHDDPPRVIIINLTNLHLGGVIPKDIADLTALTQLLLGNNTLSGHIPDLSSLKNLRILQLQNNQFIGEIPKSLEKLQMLTQLFLQGNKLEGTVSRGLVRPNLELRVDPQNDAVVGSRKIKGWVIGLSIVCSVMLVLGILSVIFFWKHKHPSQPFQTSNGRVPSQQHTFAGASTILNEKNEIDYHRLAVEYTEKDIKTSTNNYSKPIGKGSFGSVFYGRLSGFEVAVKIHKTDSNQGRKEFQNEVAMLSRIYHKNLVNLIGYCRQPIMALVYEYMPCGTLIDQLYGMAKLETPLNWLTRLNIAR